MKEEIWKEINNYEGYYAISNLGRVKRISSGRILKPHANNTGYKQVTLCVNGVRREFCVHKLAATAFIPNINPIIFTDANHIDEDKSNNNIRNLEWMTRRQNKNHSVNKRSTSMYPGVSLHNKGGWTANCVMDNKRNYLGYFKCEKLAAKAYVDFCRKNNLL